MTPGEQTLRVPVGELTFETSVAGAPGGIPVVLLHGFPGSRASWRLVTPALVSAGLRLIAPDQRGYSPGARPLEVAAYRIEHLVDDVTGLLDALDLEEAHLVGHDWGAVVGWYVAARHPDRVRSLTALSVPHPAAFGWALEHDEDQQAGSAYFNLLRQEGKAEEVLLADGARRLRGAMFGPDVPADLVEAHVGPLTEPGALTGALQWYRAMSRDFRELGPVTVPTTFLWGARDEAIRRAGVERCGEHVTGPYELVELPETGHWIPETAPDVLARSILRRVGSTSPG